MAKLESHFTDKTPSVRAIYDRLLAATREFGPVIEEVKKTSIHLVHKSAFCGVHPKKSYINLNIKSDRPLESPRILKTEQISRSRFHQVVKLERLDDVDAELLAWLRDSYKLSG